MREIITDVSSRDNINKIWGNASSRLGFLTTQNKGIHNVMTIEWMSHVQFSPPLFVISLVKGSKSHENLISSEEFGLTFASIKQFDLLKNLGTTSGKDVDKFKLFKFNWREGKMISPRIITNGVMAIECKVKKSLEFDNSSLFVGEVICVEFWDYEPIGYHQGIIYEYGNKIETV